MTKEALAKAVRRDPFQPPRLAAAVAEFGASGHSRTMTKRPNSVTVIGCLFAGAGIVGLVYHATEFKPESPFQYDLVWVCLVRLLAMICGVFLLRGRNWARWGLLGWIAYHVVLSAFHSPTELAMHGLLFAAVAYFLLRPPVSAYFRGARVQPAPIPETTDKPTA